MLSWLVLIICKWSKWHRCNIKDKTLFLAKLRGTNWSKNKIYERLSILHKHVRSLFDFYSILKFNTNGFQENLSIVFKFHLWIIRLVESRNSLIRYIFKKKTVNFREADLWKKIKSKVVWILLINSSHKFEGMKKIQAGILRKIFQDQRQV